MTQPGAPGASPPDLPAQPGQDRAGDSKIVATWFAENLSSQDGCVARGLVLSYLIGSVATSPKVRLREAVDSDRATLTEPSHHESTDARMSASHAPRCAACQDVRSHPVPVALVGARDRQAPPHRGSLTT